MRAAFALGLGLVVATSVSAASDVPDKAYLERLFVAWATMDTAKIAPFYASEPTNTWFDVAPMQFKGWAEWAADLRKLFAEHETFKLSVVGAPEFHRHGDLVWGTYLWHLDADHKGGGKDTFDGRATTVWEKRSGKWLIVHEHDSVPVAMPPAPTTP